MSSMAREVHHGSNPGDRCSDEQKVGDEMSTAFVLSGGGSLGAVQVGMLQALAERGVQPDLLVGTSAGALNAAYISTHGVDQRSLARLEAIWTRLHRRDVFPLQPLRLGSAALRLAPSLCPCGSLRRLIEEHLIEARLEDAPIPLHVVATDVRSGREVLLSTGDAVDAVLASASVPAVLPPVNFDGRELMDGGVANNAAVSQAAELGAEVIWVLPTGYACALDQAPATPLSSAVHALTLLIEQRLIQDVAHMSEQVDIRVLPPLCPLRVSSADFGHGAELVRRSREATRRWMAGGHHLHDAHPERVLSLHGHSAPHRRHRDDERPAATISTPPTTRTAA